MIFSCIFPCNYFEASVSSLAGCGCTDVGLDEFVFQGDRQPVDS